MINIVVGMDNDEIKKTAYLLSDNPIMHPFERMHATVAQLKLHKMICGISDLTIATHRELVLNELGEAIETGFLPADSVTVVIADTEYKGMYKYDSRGVLSGSWPVAFLCGAESLYL